MDPERTSGQPEPGQPPCAIHPANVYRGSIYAWSGDRETKEKES